MHPRVLSYLALAMLPGAALAAPSDAASAAPSEPSPALNQPSQPAAPVSRSERPSEPAAAGPDTQQSDPRLAATDALIGRDVITREGERIGTLRFVTVSLDDNGVSQLIIDTSGSDLAPGTSAGTAGGTEHKAADASTPTDGAESGAAASGATASSSNGNLVIVPWHMADLNAAADGIVVAATGRHLANAPRLEREALNRLTEPAVASYVIDYWAPTSELAALEGQRRQTGQSKPSSGSGQPADPAVIEKNRPSAGQASSQPPSGGSQAMTKKQAAGSQVAQNERKQSDRTVQTARSAQMPDTQPGETGSVPVALVGQEVVAAVTPPMFQLSKQLRGARVLDRQGNDIGEIRQIVVDARSGAGAYAVIEDTSAGPAPVPLKSLQWSAEGATTLMADPGSLQPDRTLSEHPDQVSREQLAQLYQRFDADPYWERGSRGRSISEQGAMPQ